MLKMRIISVGKLKEKYWQAAQAEYEKMLRRFCRLEIIELADEPTPEQPSQAERAAVLKKEGERIRRACAGYDVVIPLAIEGQEYDSPGFARALQQHMDVGRSICFISGGSLGIEEAIKEEAGLLISLSRLTFPHRFARIALLEQLFRAFKIINGESYHK